jgi:hypothetical protein
VHEYTPVKAQKVKKIKEKSRNFSQFMHSRKGAKLPVFSKG